MVFIKGKKKDPLLNIGVGISAKHSSLASAEEIAKISSIIKCCENQPDFCPIIHFSFSESQDILKDVFEIKRLWPSINRLQLNDLPTIDLHILKRICEVFSVDLPISDENFHLLSNDQFRNIITKNKVLIVLDNSKGKGIEETEESFIKKIDTLLSYGLNDIGLCGGFGPEQLDTFFRIKRFYKFNFSIDAETNLKTDGMVNVEKVKLYLHQLLRSDDPNQEGISQTRKFLEEHRTLNWDKTEINGYEFSIHSKVFNPGYFPSSKWFASELSSLVKDDLRFCEIGCGSGAVSCLLAFSNPNLEITATDISPYASENTKFNAKHLGLASRISVFTGDVLDSIKEKGNFDSIFWALPFGFLDPGTIITLEEAQVFDPGYRAIRKFFQTAKEYLKPTGRLLIGFSSDLGNLDLLKAIANEFSFKLEKVREKTMMEEHKIKFEILQGVIC